MAQGKRLDLGAGREVAPHSLSKTGLASDAESDKMYRAADDLKGPAVSEQSKIEWTDATWNPVRGCTKVSPGCTRCYAEVFAEPPTILSTSARVGRSSPLYLSSA